MKVQTKVNVMKVCIVCLCGLLLIAVAGCCSKSSAAKNSPSSCGEFASLVGPAGEQGPAGPVGAKGQVGATGAPGAGVAGATGEQGLSGPAGIRGQTGATGPAGNVARGSAGVTGPAGPVGAQGMRGNTGEQGASTVGAAGAIGRTGAAGAQGVRGDTGAEGPMLVGPTGPAGRAGPAGAQGAVGDTGARGATMAGAAGSTGPAGDAGQQGEAGATGAQGPAGIIGCWTSYRAFWFESESADIRNSDMYQVSEIADYMKQNPSLKVGIDGSIPSGSTSGKQLLAGRRVVNVREALIKAGVPASRIETGAFGDAKLARERRVEVLIRTNYYSKNYCAEVLCCPLCNLVWESPSCLTGEGDSLIRNIV